MATLPTVDQFPSFEEACAFLKKETQQCIWYLPNQSRLCKCKITTEDSQYALKLVERVGKTSLPATARIKMLEDMAELCCCPRHHRSKIYGTGLKTELGTAWNKELKVVPALRTRAEPIPLDLPLRTFAKHHIHTAESMCERICSPLDLGTGTKGSIYFYTHKSTAFAGMLKIGYTCKAISTRLLEWEGCGHGKPDLLDSILDVRHPERVELLTHFQLLEVWHEMMWCKAHQRTHIEWFKVKIDNAKIIASNWNDWMHKANPYDRRGKLAPIWEARCAALQKLGLPITAQTMLRFYERDVGLVKKDQPTGAKAAFVRKDGSVKNVALSPKPEARIKKEEEDDDTHRSDQAPSRDTSI
jgi:hypothetical protein